MSSALSIAVICTLDRQENISSEAVNSIIQQTIKPKQLIVVYGSSHIKTIDSIQSRIKETAPAIQIKCIEHNPNTTFIAARNSGLDHINGCEYIHFISSDIRLPEDFYEKTVAALTHHENCVATIPSRLKLVDNSTTEINLSNMIESPWLWLMRSKLEIAGLIVLRSSTAAQVGKFNPLLLLGADTDFFARVSNQGAWCSTSDCVATHFISQNEVNLQSQFPDYHRRWALIYENLLDTYRARDRIAPKTYRPILAKAWHQAGLELLNHMRVEEARDCFMRSLSWRLFNSSYWYLIKISRLRKKHSVTHAASSIDEE